MKRATTLIELLVSLSIIAMLAVVALPLFSVYQRRNQLSSDAETIVAVLTNARSQINNPDILARLSNSAIRIEVRANRSSSYSFKVFPKNDPTNIIDSYSLFDNEIVSVSATNESGLKTEYLGDFAIDISNKTPNEKMICYKITTSETVLDCSRSLQLTLKSTKNGALQKAILVNNTIPGQLFSISNQN